MNRKDVVPDAAIQKQILSLIQTKGDADKTLRLLLQTNIAELESTASSSADNTPAMLLQFALQQRHPRRDGIMSAAALTASAKKKDPSKSKSSDKQWALVAAKVAQSVIKLYIGGGDPNSNTAVESDIISALDLGTLALSIVCQLEPLMQLGELVLENMLYQVAKKLSEIPACTTSALWVFAAIHIRLWHRHGVLCTQLNQEQLGLADSPIMRRVDPLIQSPNPSLQLEDLVDVCTFPAPHSFHTLQYTRFLISLVNAAVNMLLAASKNGAILAIATAIEPWISHLGRIPGVDPKLPASFSDRLFRVLWKCAAAVDAAHQKPSSEQVDRSLLFRSAALSFMLKCPAYSNVYFIQQVHRVGVQHEKKEAHQKEKANGGIVSAFYLRSANALLEQRKSTTDIFTTSSLQWDYIHWLEHFSTVCEAIPPPGTPCHAIDAITVLHHGIYHASGVKAAGIVVAGCLRVIVGCIVVEKRLGAANSTAFPSEKELRQIFTMDKFHSKVASKDRDLMVAMLDGVPQKQGAASSWVEPTGVYLSGFVEAHKAVQEGVIEWTDMLLNFVLRTVRKTTTRLFSAVVGQEKSPANVSAIILSSLGVAADLLASIRRVSNMASALQHSFMACEGRVHRLAVTLSARQIMNASSTEESTHWLSMMDKSTRQLQRILDGVMTDTAQPQASLPSLIGDLQAIAREAYGCAAHFYKKDQHALVVLSLESAFALAENYLEHVLCGDELASKSGQLVAAHTSLKVDAIAALLAYSLRREGDLSKSRKCHGHAILYASETGPAALVNSGNLDKYANAIVDEFQSHEAIKNGQDHEAVAVDTVRSLCESIALAWKTRGVGEEQILSTLRLFCFSFERVGTRLLDQLRQRTDENSDSERTVSTDGTCKSIQVCGAIEKAVWQYMWDKEGRTTNQERRATLLVLNALGVRKRAFAIYYVTRNAVEASLTLFPALDMLTQAIELLPSSSTTIGGCYGWRGVLTLEICQMMGYAANRQQEIPTAVAVTEANALSDAKQCLLIWQSIDFVSHGARALYTSFFDTRGVVTCLDAVSYALSLMSHIQLETQARRLLSKVKAVANDGAHGACVDFATGLPSQLLQNSYIYNGNGDVAIDALSPDGSSTTEEHDVGVLQLRVIDAEIGLCLTSTSGRDPVQARVHIEEATAMMKEFRSAVRISSDDTHLYRAVAMRELALCVALSEVVFQEGELEDAIREAKSALSICWRISKKVGVADADGTHLELPEQVVAALGKRSIEVKQTPHLVYFQAIECWSWDILLAAKLILSRIASLYALSNRPHRSSIYYAEAMTLVGGVVPVETRNRPYFEFAQLQLLAERTSHATAVHQLISSRWDDQMDEATTVADVDDSVVTQHCEVQLQRGDLHMLDGATDQANAQYHGALSLLQSMVRRTPGANIVVCGCHRRIVKLKLQSLNLWASSDSEIDILISSLKNHKRAIGKCSDLVEGALATCQLVQASLFLLRSPTSSKAFLPLDKLKTLMNDVFVRCDHMGIAHLSQEVRLTMGQVYLLISETEGQWGTQKSLDKTGANASCVAAGLLSAYNVAGVGGVHRSKSAQEMATSISSRIGDELPSDWLIVSLSVGSSADLTLSIIPTNGCQPVSFWLGSVKWEGCIQELCDLIAASRVTLSGVTAQGAEEYTPEQKKQWWSTRNELDVQLGGLMGKMQEKLSFWRALLTYMPEMDVVNGSQTIIDEATAILLQGSTTRNSLSRRSVWLLMAVATSQATLVDSEILHCVDHISVEENIAIPADVRQRLLSVVRGHGGSSQSSAEKSCSIILILHHRLEQFPWEGLDVLQNRPVTRMPSIELILQNNVKRLNAATVEVDSTRVSYLLNPGGDLKSTQRNLEPIFNKGAADLGWRGIVGTVPDEDTIQDFLVQSDLFIYSGHGSGEKYFYRDKIAALRDQGCAAALLFGCSSGRLEREGVFGPNGAVLSYLQAGSRAVLAMLWDVTDRDVDLMSKAILEEWLLAPSPNNKKLPLSVALQRARRLCKLQYLNGLAAVCYGLPLHVATVEEPGSKRRRLV